MHVKRRLPAEWEPQDGVLLAWPHPQTDWANNLAQITTVYCEIVQAISRFEKVVIIAPDIEQVQQTLREQEIDPSALTLVPLKTNDTWCRDFGPLTVYSDGKPLLLDFGFNGWGLKFAADYDNGVTRHLHENGLLKGGLSTPGLILEGGSIESDGQGTLLTTSHCLLEENRNPHLSRPQLEQMLSEQFGATLTLWLEHGYLAGDDTDSHIDTLARLAPNDMILYVRCDDKADEHYPALQAMEQQLRTLRTRGGEPFNLCPLPWPRPAFDTEGNRLPATYANFLVINNAVLVPTYADTADNKALQTIGCAFPGREIIGIDCRALIQQHGSLHCVTMQIPKGVL